MTSSEADIMRHFRRYLASEGEMVFFNKGVEKRPPSFERAIASLIRDGLIIKERPQNAYSLTQRGYEASLTTRATAETNRKPDKPCRLNTDS